MTLEGTGVELVALSEKNSLSEALEPLLECFDRVFFFPLLCKKYLDLKTATKKILINQFLTAVFF